MSATILALMSLNLYFSYRKSKEINVKFFSLTFGFAAIYFLFTGLPGKLVQDLFWAEVLFILAWNPLFVSTFYLTKISLNIWKLERFTKRFRYLVVFLIIITNILGIIYFAPAVYRVYRGTLFCLERAPSWLFGLNGALVSFLILLNAIVFFRGGLESRDKFVSRRSLLIGSGMASLSIAAFINYSIVPNLLEPGIFFFLPGLFLFIGVFLIYFGTQYKRKTNKS